MKDSSHGGCVDVRREECEKDGGGGDARRSKNGGEHAAGLSPRFILGWQLLYFPFFICR